jgi:CBS domain containing-hemolysin-like protein
VEDGSSIISFLAFDPSRLLALDMAVRLSVQLVLLCGSAFFSGSETALFSLSRLDLQQLRRRGHPQAGKLHALLDEPRRLIVSILCGNELVNIAAISNMTGILVALYGEAKAGWITVLVMLPLLLLVGEVTPKTIAVSNPRRISSDVIARPMSAWVRLVAPLRWLIRSVSDRITTWIVGPTRSPEHLLQIDEFRSLVEDFADEGRLNATSRALINNLLAASTTEIVTILTPRSRTAFLDAELGLPEIVERFKALRHWRVPVYRGHRDNLLGFLYAEDVLRFHQENVDLTHMTLEEALHPPIVVPLTKKVDEMFDFFSNSQARAAVALNEFGGVAGFITMNDVLRFIFGAIAQKPQLETQVELVGPDVYEAPGDTRLSEFERVTHFGIRDPRMTTIAGVAFRHIDRLPNVGDMAIVDGLTITVLEMDAHRIARVRVARGSTQQPALETPATGSAEEQGETRT